ncbi:fibrinogen-like YCDxxxxGGGW domain-containing protein [Amycolatopsis sp. GM8]|uniref:fibrinogen-like YCDxxxxGGGW domain-containing protein n=1 Tax=Amycolatopsis sp. GM8 TaxID=2896530 RepID=UPI001F3FC4AA|nr:fibrinogen-like YCDxxxxGGGW domain-containing protein [Amycolatopsis sp. GM8]
MRRTAALLAVALTSLGLVLAPPAQAATPVRDGSTSGRAAASCWEVKQNNPSGKDGVYWLQTPKLVAPQQFYCDQTTDGGGWVLVGRGREGWNWYHNGQGTAKQVRENPTGPAAFKPATLPGETIDGLLDGGRTDALPDGIRLRRAANPAGTGWQEIRLHVASGPEWSWAFDGGLRLASVTHTDGKTYPGGYSHDWTANGDNGGYRIFTWPWPSHNRQMGFSYGQAVTGGSQAPANYWWQYSTEQHAIPFSQVFIRPKLTSAAFPPIADSGAAASSVRPLMQAKSTPLPWGVTGLAGPIAANNPNDERNMEVEDFAFIGNTAYVGGKFQYVQKGQNPAPGEKVEQSYLAAFDLNSGEWRPDFRPKLNGMVYSLSKSPDGKLLVGGQFTSVNGQPNTQSLAELDPGTGAVDPGWTAHVSYGTGVSNVRAMDRQGDWLYIAGQFNRLSGGSVTTPLVLSGAGRVNLKTGAPDPAWKPHFNGPVYDMDASDHGDRVYYAGRFTAVNGTAVTDQAAVSTAKNAPLVTGLKPFVSNDPTYPYQQAVLETGDKLWVGGSQHILAQYDRTDLTLLNSNIAKHGGDFQAITEINGVVYAGCHCLKYVYNGTTRFSPEGPGDAFGAPAPAPDAANVNKINFVGAWDAQTGEYLPQFYIAGLSGRNHMGAWALRGDPNGCLWFGGDFNRGSWQGSGYQWLGGFGKTCGRDTTPPTKPGWLTAKRADDGVVLNWGGATDSTGHIYYEVLRDDRVIATIDGKTWTDHQPEGSGRYWVRAIDMTGNRSASTSVATAH